MGGRRATQPDDECCPPQAASLLGGLIGPALGGLLADVSGLRTPFTLTGCAALLAALYGAVRLPETMGSRQAAESAGCAEAMPAEEVMVRASLPFKMGHLLPSLCASRCSYTLHNAGAIMVHLKISGIYRLKVMPTEGAWQLGAQ